MLLSAYDIPVKEIIKNTVKEILTIKDDGIFTVKEIVKEIMNKYPDCNTNTIRCQIYADCVNHTSRKHYKGGQLDLYYAIGNKQFRLYNSKIDGIWNSDGKKLS